jgi:hypothetical protein
MKFLLNINTQISFFQKRKKLVYLIMLCIDLIHEIKSHCRCEKHILCLLSTTKYYFEYRLYLQWSFKNDPIEITEQIQKLPYYNNFECFQLNQLAVNNPPKKSKQVYYLLHLNSFDFSKHELPYLKKVFVHMDRCDAYTLNNLFSHPSIEYIEVLCPINLEYIKFPLTIKSLTIFSTHYNLCTSLPKTLKTLRFMEYNEPLYQLPPTLEKLYLGKKFNRKIRMGDLPSSLCYLHLGDAFNQPLDPEILPKGLIELNFGFRYNQKIKPGVIPHTVKKISFGCHFKRVVGEGVIPEGVEILTMETYFIKLIKLEDLPLSLKKIRIPMLRYDNYKHLVNQWFDICVCI